jgi:ubiquinone biosynthesis protein
MFTTVRRVHSLPRYRQIITTFARHGFGAVLEQMGVDRALLAPARILRKDHDWERLTPAQHFRLALEEWGPTFIKLGQIMSTRPDLLPPDFIEELSKLQDSAPPIPWEEVESQLTVAWNHPWNEWFASIDPTPLAAASLAQVHAATLSTGEEVVIKVQRPDIWPTIQADLAVLEDLAALAQHTSLGELYNPVDIVTDFSFTLQNELNYLREGRNADRFRRNFTDEPYLYIPKVYWEFTTKHVLVLERLRGVKIDDIAGLEEAGLDAKIVALNAARIIIKEVLEDGFFHADPHPGNFYVLPGNVIGAMDFGMVGHLSETDRLNLVRLYIASVRMDADAIVEQLIRMGAAAARVNRPALRRDITRLLEKYNGLPLKEIRAKEVVSDIMPIAWRHHLSLPSDLWLLGKTMAMMEGVGLQLDPDFDIFAVSEPFVQKLAREMWSPSVWGPQVLGQLQAWSDVLAIAPRASAKLLYGLESGELPLELNMNVQKPALESMDRALTRLSVSVLIAAFILALAFLIPRASASPIVTALIVVGFLVSSGLGVWFLISVLRRLP